MTPWLDDGDVRIYVGDALETLAGLPDASVDCVITSPPYWGLRDYGTGSWAGGDPDCDHLGAPHRTQAGFNERYFGRDHVEGWENKQGELREPFRDVCGKCGAQRTDQQHGLEPTPDLYVANMVAVFREVRRVLAPHGTCWVNLGDSYVSTSGIGQGRNRDGGDGFGASRANYGELFGLKLGSAYKPKDLCGIPWRVAFALQADGWWLRSDIVWAKPNPMPESVTDRPTKSHEYVFLLTRQPRYWFDAEAVREPSNLADTGWVKSSAVKVDGNGTARPPLALQCQDGLEWGSGVQAGAQHTYRLGEIGGGRNVRSVWEIATQPYAEAHFATFPEELVRRCLLAGCPEWVCRACGKPRERIVEREVGSYEGQNRPKALGRGRTGGHGSPKSSLSVSGGSTDWAERGPKVSSVGWSDCGHNDYRPGVVLDPFLGSGTTALVARKHGRHVVGVELSEDYAKLAARRLQQLSLLA